MKKTRFTLNTVRTYTQGGEERRGYTEVGVAWLGETKDGAMVLSLRVYPGISVSGELVAFEARPKAEGKLPRGQR